MQTLLTVIVLLALVALGALFLVKLNSQSAGRLATHRHPAPPRHHQAHRPAHRFWARKTTQDESPTIHPGSHAAQRPPRDPLTDDDARPRDWR
ncbi:hypothetical protein [Streptomyces sp. NPDC048248]|uniref:hypothetical protein n=1 Tax=Streptomyces sp. NPDC048248 TaxID=3365523 RepID=UPI00371BB63E